MNKKLLYFGILPLALTVVLAVILYLLYLYVVYPKADTSLTTWIGISVTFYIGMLIGCGFLYLMSEGWGDKETIPDKKGQNKIILIAAIIGLILTTLLTYSAAKDPDNSILEIISESHTLFLWWLIFFGISWAILDICIWIKKHKKKR